MRRLRTSVLLAVVGWAVFSLWGLGGSGGSAHADTDLVGSPSPPLVVEQWLGAVPEPAGRMVLVDFWATWCPPCRALIPELNAWQRRFGDRLLVVGLTSEQPAAVHAMTSPVIEYAVAVDTQGRMAREVGVRGIPHVLLVDPQGVVRWQGFPFETGHELTAEVVDALLDEHVRPD